LNEASSLTIGCPYISANGHKLCLIQEFSFIYNDLQSKSSEFFRPKYGRRSIHVLIIANRTSLTSCSHKFPQVRSSNGSVIHQGKSSPVFRARWKPLRTAPDFSSINIDVKATKRLWFRIGPALFRSRSDSKPHQEIVQLLQPLLHLLENAFQSVCRSFIVDLPPHLFSVLELLLRYPVANNGR
jgi:hypothetical protein